MKTIVIKDEIEMNVFMASMECGYDMNRDMACETELTTIERVQVIDTVAHLAVVCMILDKIKSSPVKYYPVRVEFSLTVWPTVYRVLSGHLDFLEDTVFDEPNTPENQKNNNDHLNRLIATVRIQERMKQA